MEAGFYFELDETKIINLYYEFEQNYLPVIEDVAANAIRDVSTRFTTIQFFTNRSSIDEEMHLELQTRLAECCFTRVPIFNLLGIDVPERFRDAVEDVVIMQQERTTKEVLRDALVLRQSIRVVDATAENTITGPFVVRALNLTEAMAAADHYRHHDVVMYVCSGQGARQRTG